MPDVFTQAKRSQVMALIRAKDTKPELAVRRALHGLGYRFRLHDARLPGRPDIVLRKHQLIIEVKGCFWHSHRCLKGRIPVGNRDYWLPKLAGNQRRDREKARRLRAMGWRVKTVWECEVRRQTPEGLATRLQKFFA
ncbi:MAG: DNA mismatch endonuclease Vsr [Candidatus Binataceae bacterium]|jgi:DNA mismatch endonuclease (patch repair protein)